MNCMMGSSIYNNHSMSQRHIGNLISILPVLRKNIEFYKKMCDKLRNLLVQVRFSFHRRQTQCWNNIPTSIRSASTLESFKSRLKTRYFEK